MALDLFTCMKIFTGVAEHQGFSAAARQLRLSTPVLTKQIQRLENSLGKKLFTRTTRQVQLTEAGIKYFAYAKNILMQVDDAKDAINNLEITPHGHLRLGISGILNTLQFNKSLNSFLHLYPKISLEVTVNNSPYKLLNNEIDLTISDEIIHEKQLIKESLLLLQRKIYAAPIYLKKYGTPKTVKDLKQHNCLIYKPISPDNAWIINNKKLSLATNYITDSDRNFMHAAINGMGLAWSSELCVREELKSGKLVEVKLKGTIKKNEIFLDYRPTHSGSNIRLLIDHIKKFVTN